MPKEILGEQPEGKPEKPSVKPAQKTKLKDEMLADAAANATEAASAHDVLETAELNWLNNDDNHSQETKDIRDAAAKWATDDARSWEELRPYFHWQRPPAAATTHEELVKGLTIKHIVKDLFK